MVPIFGCRDRVRGHRRRSALVALVESFGLLLMFALPAGASSLKQQRQPKPLGSLSVVGGVTVNGSPAQPAQTVFAGDTLATSNNGTATFTVSGQGSFKIAPLGQVSFSDDQRYIIELKRGTVVMNTFAAHSNLALRIGDYIVVADPVAAQAAIVIKGQAGGSGLVSCLAGGAHILAMQGETSLSLEAGQSTSISPEEQTVAATATPPPSRPRSSVKKDRLWIILGLAGAGGAAGVALAVSGGGGHSVSPTNP